jgi:KDO2-lipid IV(A) lauroyltransferase
VTPRIVRAYQAGAWLAQHTPVPIGDAVASGLGSLVSAVPSERRFMAERNMQRVHGPGLEGRALARARREVFRSYARYWVESLRLPSLPPDEIERGLTYEGLEHILEARARGVGAIVALPHLGGWEWSAFWAAVIGHFPVTAVVEELEPRELFEWFAGFRESLGMHVVPLGPEAGTAVTKALRAGHAVPLLCDRDIGGTGIEVEFFGERTTLPGGPVTLALRTGAPLLPSAVYFSGYRRHALLGEPMDLTRHGSLRDDVTRLTQELAVHLERLIREAPEQWHLLQPNWPSDHVALEQYRAARERH